MCTAIRSLYFWLNFGSHVRCMNKVSLFKMIWLDRFDAKTLLWLIKNDQIIFAYSVGVVDIPVRKKWGERFFTSIYSITFR